MSAIIGTKQYKCYFDQSGGSCTGPKASVQGGITASMAGGSWLGALISGLLSDRLGRKRAIMIGAVIWYSHRNIQDFFYPVAHFQPRCIGSIIVCASQNIAMLIIGRVINGLSVGICSAQVPVYISELAPPSKRGRLVGAQQWAITWGIMIMFYISVSHPFPAARTFRHSRPCSTGARTLKAPKPSVSLGVSK